jgi:hypothetical protein
MAVHPRRFWASYSLPWELKISQSAGCVILRVSFNLMVITNCLLKFCI